MAEEDWYYAEGDTPQGPFTRPEFEALARGGKIVSATLVWCTGMDDWRPASEVVPGLLSSAPPPPPPPPSSTPPPPVAGTVPRAGSPLPGSRRQGAAQPETEGLSRHQPDEGAYGSAQPERGVRSLGEAISTCFRKYATFSGRANRPEYWYFVLFVFIVSMAISLATGFDQEEPSVASGLWSLGTFLPSLAAVVRRLHDTGRSGWWWLIVFIPLIGWIILIVWLAKRGEAGPNRFGPAPA